MIQHLAVGSIFLLLITGCAMPLTPRESGTLTGAGFGAATGEQIGAVKDLEARISRGGAVGTAGEILRTYWPAR